MLSLTRIDLRAPSVNRFMVFDIAVFHTILIIYLHIYGLNQ